MPNNINYTIISITEIEIWPLDEVKNYLRVHHNNDDKLIISLINSAIISAELFLGISLFIKKINCLVGRAPNYFRVKYIPILSLGKIFLIEGQNREDITENFDHMDINNEKIWIDSKYLNKKIEINYEAGIGGKIPPPIWYGILLHISMMYDFGENSANISEEIKQIYLPYRALKI